ncbi:MAG: nitronate monooxygenase [Dysgonamonadaceae bacterium]|nr:nitronate monooxygenase [Dysgonamonadaceae bacterium]MDD4729532.1 nitronate monooxygenase [Dysgonamonadaceae bacterium]
MTNVLPQKKVSLLKSKLKMSANKITELFEIKYPIIQAGMVWCSGWRLASTVSNAGGLGLIGAGSMYPDVLREHIIKCKAATKKPFGVNVPLLYPQVDELMQIIIEEKVPIVFTSAGNPKIWTSMLQQNGIKVVHVVSSSKFAIKSQEAGVDAIVAEGFEAGGHNGREETTTFTLIPQVRNVVDLPLIAAGGIATGKGMLAAMTLGADGVQVGTRFALTHESSASDNFKEHCVKLPEGETILSLKKVSPTRLVKNEFFYKIQEMEHRGATAEEIREVLGRGRARKGIFEGNLIEGELEIGQIASSVESIIGAEEVIKEMIEEFNVTAKVISVMAF